MPLGLAMRTRNMQFMRIMRICANMRGVACLALLSILSAQNIIFAHPTWFYPSSGMENKSPESQYFGQKKLIFFYYLMRFMQIMRI